MACKPTLQITQQIYLIIDKVAIKFLNVQNPSPVQRDAFRNEAAILKYV
jgi:hypothetical protein